VTADTPASSSSPAAAAAASGPLPVSEETATQQLDVNSSPPPLQPQHCVTSQCPELKNTTSKLQATADSDLQISSSFFSSTSSTTSTATTIGTAAATMSLASKDSASKVLKVGKPEVKQKSRQVVATSMCCTTLPGVKNSNKSSSEELSKSARPVETVAWTKTANRQTEDEHDQIKSGLSTTKTSDMTDGVDEGTRTRGEGIVAEARRSLLNSWRSRDSGTETHNEDASVQPRFSGLVRERLKVRRRSNCFDFLHKAFLSVLCSSK